MGRSSPRPFDTPGYTSRDLFTAEAGSATILSSCRAVTGAATSVHPFPARIHHCRSGSGDVRKAARSGLSRFESRTRSFLVSERAIRAGHLSDQMLSVVPPELDVTSARRAFRSCPSTSRTTVPPSPSRCHFASPRVLVATAHHGTILTIGSPAGSSKVIVAPVDWQSDRFTPLTRDPSAINNWWPTVSIAMVVMSLPAR